MNIVVIGGSAGAFTALQQIISELPATLNSAVFIVLHFPENKKSYLPQILNTKKNLHAEHAIHNSAIQKGRIYIAPPGFHLIVNKNKIMLSNGPKENRFRPSVDVLFRSAALAYGSLVTGVILSGALDDGAAGLLAIKNLGGTAIVQNPDEAIINSMPLNAIKAVDADYCVGTSEIAPILKSIADNTTKLLAMKKHEPEKNALIEWENTYAQGEIYDIETITKHASPTRYICPLCEGPLFKLHDKEFSRYRCFTGHALSGETLLKETSNKMEHLLWTAYRTLDEKKEMLKSLMQDKEQLKKEEENIDRQLGVLNKLRQSNEDARDTLT